MSSRPLPPPRPRSIRSLASGAALCALLLGAVGCTSAVPEPVDAYSPIAEQSYPFDAVWQCASEAIEVVGYTITDSRRNGDEDGQIMTDFKIVKQDAFSEHAEALRLSVRLRRKADKVYAVEVAPSRFQREYTRDAWSYWKKEPALLKSFEDALGAALRKRYRGG